METRQPIMSSIQSTRFVRTIYNRLLLIFSSRTHTAQLFSEDNIQIIQMYIPHKICHFLDQQFHALPYEYSHLTKLILAVVLCECETRSLNPM
jgi:hypothetical protein